MSSENIQVCIYNRLANMLNTMYAYTGIMQASLSEIQGLLKD